MPSSPAASAAGSTPGGSPVDRPPRTPPQRVSGGSQVIGRSSLQSRPSGASRTSGLLRRPQTPTSAARQGNGGPSREETAADQWDDFKKRAKAKLKQTVRKTEQDEDVVAAAFAGFAKHPAQVVSYARLALELSQALDRISEISDAMGTAKVHTLDSGTLRDWSLRIDDGVREVRSLGREYARAMTDFMRDTPTPASEPGDPRSEGNSSVATTASPKVSPSRARKDTIATARKGPRRPQRSGSAGTQPPAAEQSPAASPRPGRAVPLSAPEAIAAGMYCCTEAAAGLLQADRACVWLPDNRRGDLAAAVLVGYPGVRPCELRCAENEGVVGGCYVTRMAASSLIVPKLDLKNIGGGGGRNGMGPKGYRIWSSLVVPLVTPSIDTVKGVVQFVNKNGGDHFSPDDECMAWRCAQLLAFLLTHYGVTADLGAHGFDPSVLQRAAVRPAVQVQTRENVSSLRLLSFDSRTPQRKQLVLRDLEGFAFQDFKGERVVANSTNLQEASNHLRQVESGWRKAVELNRLIQEQLQSQGSNMRAALATLQSELAQERSTCKVLRELMPKARVEARAAAAESPAPSPAHKDRPRIAASPSRVSFLATPTCEGHESVGTGPQPSPAPAAAAAAAAAAARESPAPSEARSEHGTARGRPPSGTPLSAVLLPPGGPWPPLPGAGVRILEPETLERACREVGLTWRSALGALSGQEAIVCSVDPTGKTVRLVLRGGFMSTTLPLAALIPADVSGPREDPAAPPAESPSDAPGWRSGTPQQPGPPPLPPPSRQRPRRGPVTPVRSKLQYSAVSSGSRGGPRRRYVVASPAADSARPAADAPRGLSTPGADTVSVPQQLAAAVASSAPAYLTAADTLLLSVLPTPGPGERIPPEELRPIPAGNAWLEYVNANYGGATPVSTRGPVRDSCPDPPTLSAGIARDSRTASQRSDSALRSATATPSTHPRPAEEFQEASGTGECNEEDEPPEAPPESGPQTVTLPPL
eukprot:TRINITY_DN176_c1_g1_i1.p1 TRINITY_DN176_c1_g1~~TRINITY_DN176_c1_g1_i1.p1  ORF type:complete len:1014 (+),score=239.89 TRINITY_DN176_c1_g1_i1:83-3043(+)